MKKYVYILVLNTLLLLPNFALVFYGLDSITATLLKSIVFLIIGFSLVTIGVVIVNKRIYYYLMMPVVLLQFVEITNIMLFKLSTSNGVINAIFNTNFKEASEFLSGQSIYVFIIVLIIFIVYVFFTNKLDKDKLFSTKRRLEIITLFIGFHFVLLGRDYKISNNVFPKNDFIETMGCVKYSFFVRFNKTFPFNYVNKILGYFNYKKAIEEYHDSTNGFYFSAVEEDSVLVDKTFVLVIGETARSDHFKLNGYYRDTNPKLSSNTTLVSYPNAYAAANSTGVSLPFVFTRATPESQELMLEEKSLINAFKECDYSVYWLSNQNYSNSELLNYYSEESDLLITNSASIDSDETYDQVLVDQFKRLLDSTKSVSKRLIIVHTLGSHFRYNYRYPNDFKKYNPGMEEGFSLMDLKPENIEKLINSYDNSIYYTDYILSELIENIDPSKVSALVYLSDHGENLCDDENNLLVHGGARPTKYELNVPLIVWMSDKYEQTYPEISNSIRSNKNAYYSTSNIPYLIWGLGNISTGDNRKKYLTSPEYQEPDTIHSIANGEKFDFLTSDLDK
jgi:glucan phosphoethanolaminetransferase (alkaline phosphatase superfamily)